MFLRDSAQKGMKKSQLRVISRQRHSFFGQRGTSLSLRQS